MNLQDFLSRLDGVKGYNNQYSAKCPAHDDHNASLSVSTGKDGKIIMKCHAGCEVKDILFSLGLAEKDLFQGERQAPQQKKWELVARYNYTDEKGRFLFQKTRWNTAEGKTFTWNHQDNSGHWQKGRGGRKTVLYNLQEVAGADTVYLVEGEKDVETLRKVQLVATSSPDGAGGSWQPSYTEALRGKIVYIIQDNDTPGKTFARKAAEALYGAAKQIKIIDLAEDWDKFPEHGDATDAYNLTPQDFKGKLEALTITTPDFEPGAEPEIEDIIKLVCLDDIQEKNADWLVPGYIPKGQIVTIGADGGTGKSFVWCSLVASISNGTMPFLLNENDYSKFGGYHLEPQKVVFFSAEDDASTVLKKRIRNHGGNMKNIFLMGIDDEKMKDFSFDSPLLEKIIQKYRPALVVFDPVQAFVGKTNMVARNEMRLIMEPLIRLGAKYNCTFLIICHTNKKQGVFGRQRIADSSDLWDISRSVFLVGKTGQENINYISHEKSNYGKNGETVLFSIENGVIINKGFTSNGDRFYQNEYFLNKKTYQIGAKQDAEDFILDFLKDKEQCSAKDLNEVAKAMNFSQTTLRNAKKSLQDAGLLGFKVEGLGKGKGTNYLYFLQDGEETDVEIEEPL